MSTQKLTPNGYPDSWPKPNKLRPDSLISKVTDEEKRDLYLRKLTTRALAARYGVKETWVSTLYPGKVPIESQEEMRAAKSALIKTRHHFRRTQAALVLAGKLSIRSAAKTCGISYRSMARAVQTMRQTAQNAPTGAANE